MPRPLGRGVSLLTNCASSPIALNDSSIISQDESIVFGRVKVVTKDRPILWSGGLFGPGNFIMLIMRNGTSDVIRYTLIEDGSFYWHLKPGDYAIIGYEWELGSYRKGRVFADFTIPKDKPVTYIGTLTIAFASEKYGAVVEDEYDLALEKFREKFSTIKEIPSKSLLKMEKQR